MQAFAGRPVTGRKLQQQQSGPPISSAATFNSSIFTVKATYSGAHEPAVALAAKVADGACSALNGLCRVLSNSSALSLSLAHTLVVISTQLEAEVVDDTLSVLQIRVRVLQNDAALDVPVALTFSTGDQASCTSTFSPSGTLYSCSGLSATRPLEVVIKAPNTLNPMQPLTKNITSEPVWGP